IRASTLPWTIIQPAIFSGNSETAFTGYDYRMGYGLLLGLLYAVLPDEKIGGSLEAFFEKREKLKNCSPEDYISVPCRMKGYPNVTKNFMFIDDIVGQTNVICESDNIASKTFHVITKKPITIAQMLDSIQKALRIKDVEFSGNFDTAELSKNKLERRALKFVDNAFNSYMTRWEPHWETKNTDECLKKANYKRIDMTPRKFDWLMEEYVNKELPTVLKNLGRM
ncbi:MAG: hypothetical protein WC637_02915, partial [Victivallales bacterium]